MRRAGAVLALALLLGGCGGGTQRTPRAEVASYITQVNATERQLTVPLSAVTRTIVGFARQARSRRPLVGIAPPATQATSLGRAATQIDVLRGRLAALQAPAPALRLRTLVLQLVDRQARLTRQMAKLVVFLPGFAQAMAPLGPALVRLERVLSISAARGAAAVAAVYAEKAAALLNFRASALIILRDLHALEPPTVSLPPFRAQVRAVSTMATAASGLAQALSQGNAAAARPLLAQFSQAATGPASLAVQRAQVAAIRTYDARLGSLNRLAEQASRERLRLARALS